MLYYDDGCRGINVEEKLKKDMVRKCYGVYEKFWSVPKGCTSLEQMKEENWQGNWLSRFTWKTAI